MTTVYFIRHAQADNSVRDGAIRPLTEKGMTDRALVTAFLQDKGIDAVLSSPYKRAVDTVADFAERNRLSVLVSEGFKEHSTISDNYPDSEYFPFIKRYWADFHYKVSDDESLFEVQERNIASLNDALVKYKGKSIAIGTHGIALSTIINYYDPTYKFENFVEMVKIKPWVVRMDFSDDGCVGMVKTDLFRPERDSYTYHPMQIADYDEIYALWTNIPGVGLSEADSRGNIEAYLLRNPGQSFICKSGGKIVGTILCGNDGRRAYIHHTAVVPEHRRQRIAAELVRLAMETQRSCGIGKCHLFIFGENESGKAFWREMGFAERSDIGVMSNSL